MKAFLFILISFFSTGIYAQNQNISQGTIFDGEPFIAVNPSNPKEMVVAWMSIVIGNRVQIKTKYSTNNGQTWSLASLIPHPITGYTSADPSLAFDDNGNVYLSFIDFTGFINPNVQGAVFITKSANLGQTWNAPIQVLHTNDDPGKRCIDRPWMVIDKSGTASNGNIYITTMNAKGSTFGYNPYISVSTNGGNSFNWRYLDTTNFLSGNIINQPMPTPAITSTGTLHAVYPSYKVSQNINSLFILASSTDNGSSFNYNTVTISNSNVSDSLAKKGYLLKSNPANPNHLVFLYLRKTNDNADVFMVESTNDGLSWTNPIQINDDNTNALQDLIWADFDTDGDLVVAWRDRRNGATTDYLTDSEIWAAVRWKDSTKFSANFKVSNTLVAYDNILSESGNDFMCIEFVNDTINAVWGDTRTGKLNIWYSRMDAKGNIVSLQNIASEKTPFFTAYPNPFNSQITFDGLPENKSFVLRIFNTEGKQVLTSQINANTPVRTNQLTPGLYFYRLVGNEKNYTGEIIKQ